MRPIAGFTAAALTFAACAGPLAGDEADDGTAPAPTTADDNPTADTGRATATPPSSAPPTTVAPLYDIAPNGAPLAADNPEDLAAQLAFAHEVIADPTASPDELDVAGHLHQVAYRKLGRNPEWDGPVADALPNGLAPVVLAGAGARRPFKNLLSEPPANLPAWEIVEPPPADELLAHYREAESVFGIPWQYLAAINLVETGMGRIRGLSTAGARGPMQFIPATWERFGEGDIDDPLDSIMAAARYLAYEAERDGGPVEPGSDSLLDALWHYNNHDSYVNGVKAFADLMIADERLFFAYHQWEIYYWSTEGDIWLPVGWRSEESIPAADWVAENPQR